VMRWGAFESPNGSVEAFQAADARYGVKLELARTFWDLDVNLPTIAALVADGRTPVVSLAAKHWRFPGHTKDQILSEIAAGFHDDLLTSLASGFAALGVPIYLTLEHEADMAIDHEAYWLETYLAAYRRFYSVIRPASKNIRIGPIFTGWYAREHYAEWRMGGCQFIGVDPYCWPQWWRTPADMLAEAIPPIVDRWPRKHILVCETACDEDPRKPDWIRALPDALAAYPQIRGVMWFDVNKENDWRLDSSPASLEAARTMLKGGNP